MNVDILPSGSDNYIFALIDGAEAVIIDPGEAGPVRQWLQKREVRVRAILLTHAHGDHVAGAPALRAQTGCAVIGPAGAGLPGLDRELRDGERVDLPAGGLVALSTPGHLPVHLSYYDAANDVLFCGDTLFAGGCGRIMGSTAVTLWQSLCRLRALPPQTRMYCGHEYTVDNLAFAANLEPGHAAVAERLAAAQALRAAGKPTLPSTIALERATNPFLRADDPALQQAVQLPGAPAATVFAELRRRKDRW